MTTKFFTAKEIISLHEKYNKNEGYGNLFDIDLTKIGQSKSSKLKCYYIPLLIKNFDGTTSKFKFKFSNQLLASNAKLSPYADENKNKDVSVMFRKIAIEDLEKSNYENNDMNNMHNNLILSNREFIKANEIINNEYKALVQNKIITYKGKDFSIKNKRISSYVQEYRNLMEAEKHKTDEELGFKTFETEKGERCVKLECSLFRFKIPVEQDAPYRIGFHRIEGKTENQNDDNNNNKRKFEYVIFDHRNAKKSSNGWINSPAKVLKNDKYVDLDINTIGLFVSYLSLVSGTAIYDSIILSSQGISLKPKINEMHVVHHKRQKKDYMEDDDYNSMTFVMNSMKKTDNEYNDLIVDNEEEEKTKNFNKLSMENSNDDETENNIMDEPEENTNIQTNEKKVEEKKDPINEEIEQKLNKTVITSKKKLSKKKQVSDDEN
jgi:hypothetical protein